MSSLSDSDLNAIHAASAKYQELAIANDWDSWINLMAEDTIYLPPHEPAQHGREAVRAWVDTFPHVDDLSLTIEEILGAGDLAIVRGSFQMQVTADGESMSDNGKYIEIWGRQEDGAWRLVRDIWNSSVAAG